VSGPAAAALGELARDRWRALGAERLPVPSPSPDDLWPEGVTADLEEVPTAIARTMPGSGARPPVRECEALFIDSIALARQSIYIESQYFTNEKIARALNGRLRQPDGPEVIVIAPRECQGWLEKSTMGAFRDGVFREMLAADVHGRLRLVYPAASQSRGVATFIHSKVMVVDDEFARIGSANCSRRSMGVDTECDLAVNACGEPRVRTGIRRIRDRLLGEHLSLQPDVVSQQLEHGGSLRQLVDRHARGEHTLVRVELPARPEEAPSEAVRAAADPDEPIGLATPVGELVPAVDARRDGSPLRLWVLPSIVLAAAVVVAWAASVGGGPHELRALERILGAISASPDAVWIGAVVFLAAGLMLVPLELLALGAGLSFGAAGGGGVAAMGSLAAAVVGYGLGRLMGRTRLSRWMSRQSFRSGGQLQAKGLLDVVALRLASVASAGSVHLLCGAWRVPFARYLLGTAIGMAPAIAALCLLGGLLRQTLLQPSIANGLLAIGAAVVVIAIAAGLRTLLLFRQFGPSISGHRSRAEFG
jgi:uncharacterized membrane protein YdjX (TVP38/TMEM64 family)